MNTTQRTFNSNKNNEFLFETVLHIYVLKLLFILTKQMYIIMFKSDKIR